MLTPGLQNGPGELELELHHFIPNYIHSTHFTPPVIPFLSVLIGVHIP